MPDIPAISQCRWSLAQPSYSQVADDADESLLRRIMTDDGHVLQPLLPDRPAIPYTQGRIRHINDGANAPWKNRGEGFCRNLGGREVRKLFMHFPPPKFLQ